MNFYKNEVGDYFEKPNILSDAPNIILIFTEGLSQNIIEDERNIMPNVKEYETKSLSFENYYNHTAATYRGIIGQLFSAHQFNNNDENRLIPVQSILQEKGYNTTFLNAEPQNADFTEYLNSLGFNNVINNETKDRYFSSDKDMYELLYKTITDSGNDIPQFIVMYTFCTHVSFESDDQMFGDGTNSLLNKFYNADYQFGDFMAKISESEYADNTIIIFTADHATFCDDDFRKTFYPYYTRDDAFCDEIPLFIWYKGVNPCTVNVNGRNSIGLAPTILDFIDVNAPNFFLGNSLFQGNIEMQQKLLINTTFAVPDYADWRVRTDNGKIRELTNEEVSEFDGILNEYLSNTIRAKVIVP